MFKIRMRFIHELNMWQKVNAGKDIHTIQQRAGEHEYIYTDSNEIQMNLEN